MCAQTNVDNAPTPDAIMQLGTAFWASKTLLSAVELGLFTELAGKTMNAKELQSRLSLHPRGARDFFDALVALGMLERKGQVYSNMPSTDLFLDRNKPSYIGGILEMMNARLYGFWGSLTEALRTGEPQNEAKSGGDLFESLYSDPARLRGFLAAMTGVSGGTAMAIAQKFPWREYNTVIDIGCAEGCVPAMVAKQHPHLKGGGFDLEVVRPHFERFIAAQGLSDRLKFHAGDFFKDPLPSADVLILGHILHDWSVEEKKNLLQKAHRALKPGGVLIVYDAVIDDERSKNVFGLLMSLNMLIETRGGFDYTGSDCIGWMREAGFRDARVEALVGPDSMVIGKKA
jgi:SAM-dependent methyltransferase